MAKRDASSTEDYFAAAYAILADDGYSGLKLANLCDRLNVTTGAFYHNFRSWKEFSRQFLRHWHVERTTRLIELAAREDDPAARLKLLLDTATALPHRAEAAIRVWSTLDPEVATVQHSVDVERLQISIETFKAMSFDDDAARRRAAMGLYLIIGHELAGDVGGADALAWSLERLIDTTTET